MLSKFLLYGPLCIRNFCMWIYCHEHVNTWPRACGYTAKRMRIHSTWLQGHMSIAHNQILHVDTQPLVCILHLNTRQIICGYMTMWIHGHMHVDILPHAHGQITTGYTWDLIFIQFKAGTALWPQHRNGICAVAHSAEPDPVLWLITQHGLKVQTYRQIWSHFWTCFRLRIRGLGGIDSWKKLEVEYLVRPSF
jgi:hypothetical protein